MPIAYELVLIHARNWAFTTGGVSIYSCGAFIDHLRVADKHWNKPVSCRMFNEASLAKLDRG